MARLRTARTIYESIGAVATSAVAMAPGTSIIARSDKSIT